MKHLDECGEGYFKHMFEAWRIVSVLLISSIACLIHSLFPFVFQKTASTMIRNILNRTDSRYAKKI